MGQALEMCVHCENKRGCDNCTDLHNWIMEHLEPKQEWISVKDRLPERTLPPHDVLVYHDLNCGMFVDRAWYSYDMGKWCSVLGMKLKVTHWMPLPESPKEL